MIKNKKTRIRFDSLFLNTAVDFMELCIRIFSSNDGPYLDSDIYNWTGELEKNIDIIRNESRELNWLKVPFFHNIQKKQKPLSQDSMWRVFHLYYNGTPILKNHKFLPKTASLIEGIPHLRSAMLSYLPEGKSIPPHRGPYKGVIRYHLGIALPQLDSNFGIIVDGLRNQWREDNSFFIDDSFIHYVWNHTNEPRVILIVDVERPLPKFLQFFNQIVIRHISSLPSNKDMLNKLL